MHRENTVMYLLQAPGMMKENTVILPIQAAGKYTTAAGLQRALRDLGKLQIGSFRVAL